MEELRPLIVDIFLYYRFTSIKNALIAKERVNDCIKKMNLPTGKDESPNRRFQYIFNIEKKLKEYCKGHFVLYPNLSSRRKYYSERKSLKPENNFNWFRKETIKHISELKDSISSILKIIVMKYLKFNGQKLSHEVKKAIEILPSKEINSEIFKSIINAGICGINLEENNNIFGKFYNAIEIQKFITFVKICMYEKENQLTCLEYIALLQLMNENFKKYKISGKEGIIDELFHDSLCFFVESFSYCQTKSNNKIIYSFEKDLVKHKKGFKILRQLFPNWKELVSEDNFCIFPQHSIINA